MGKILRRTFMFFSIVILYFIVKELLFLYSSLKDIHPYVAYGFVAIILLLTIFYIVVPIIRVLQIPVFKSPSFDAGDRNQILRSRLKSLRKNAHLVAAGVTQNQFESTEEEYNQYISALKPGVEQIRKQYVKRVFISTTIAQNGFLDAFILLSTNATMVREIFSLYNGRVNNLDLLKIYGSVYRVVIAGGSDITEDIAEGATTFLLGKSTESIPIFGKVAAAISDGIVNATLTTRISFIVERYCSLIIVKKRSDLKPTGAVVKEIVKISTEPIVQAVKSIGKKRKAKVQDSTTDENAKLAVTNIIKEAVEESAKGTEDEEEARSILNSLQSGASYIGSPFYSAGRFVSNSLSKKSPNKKSPNKQVAKED
ncbi:MAG: DUF697 domain-containing protein [Cyclobacteriaceae bacterium]